MNPDYNPENNSEYVPKYGSAEPEDDEQRINERRRSRAEQFKMNIKGTDYDVDAETAPEYDEEINSYSDQEVKKQMAKESRHALKKRKKEEKKALKAKNKRNRRVFRWVWLISIAIVGAMAGMYLVTGMNDLLAINRSDSTAVKITIPENPTLDDVTEVLADGGVIEYPSYFKLFAQITKAADDFTQGTYEIAKNMDYEAIINFLTSTSNRTDTVSVTITEGESVLEIAETLSENGALGSEDEFLSLCNSDTFDDDFDFIKEETDTDTRYYKLEGYLYPDTYDFYKNEDAKSVIYKFLNNYESKITEKQTIDGYDKRTSISKLVESSDYSLDEIMTIASIIQAEAADEEDMYYISSILHNRLTSDADEGLLSLSLDSTKFYPYRSLEDVPEDDRSTYESRYDTYSIQGLPAGPICNPGMDAILAALNPYETSYNYFCHDSSGNAYYAETQSGHNANLEYIESYE